MSIHRIISFIILSLLYQQISYCQIISETPVDSLRTMSFQELKEKIWGIHKIDTINKVYAKAYLEKGKDIDNSFHISRGYYNMSRLYLDHLEKRITYIDSAINVIKNTEDTNYLAFLYTHKGAISEEKGVFDKALNYYLEGLKVSKKTKNTRYSAILQHNIALLKRYFGKYEEAKELFKKCIAYEKLNIGKKRNDTLPYLLGISELIVTYRKNKEINAAICLNDQNIKLAKGTDIECLFLLNTGIIQYHQGKYKKAIDNIEIGLDKLSKSKYRLEYGNHYLIDSYLFLGKSYNAISKKEIATPYFKKIDSIILKSNFLIPETRFAYLKIIEYYKSRDDKNNQLYYINRLLYNDSILDRNYRYLSNKLTEEYDTPILLENKEKLIKELEAKKNKFYYGLITLLFLTLIISTLYTINYQKNKRYKVRFNELILSKNEKTEPEKLSSLKTRNNTNESNSFADMNIAEEVIEIILKGLDAFENKNGFLEANITSGILAKKMNTNSKYLTKVIKFYRKKSFSPYINDLRIDYIIEKLTIDTKLQKYTIKALAVEAGFNSAEVFSKSFFKKTGVYPSFFVKQVQQLDNQ
ncbi:AraC family transcriptional regulator [Aquimarina longa]|uniref:AraC family transcriptional regulator n=1 Tax=Aquimarina longa TaxID=1080221 RepID=UPI0009EA26B1|nr:AraC family transcriptional regulator [Aquimarina longa]